MESYFCKYSGPKTLLPRTNITKAFFLCSLYCLICLPLAYAGPSVRTQTAAARSATPYIGLRGSYLDSYEQRVYKASLADERYEEQLQQWEQKRAAVEHKEELKALEKARKEKEKQLAEQRKQIALAKKQSERKSPTSKDEAAVSKQQGAVAKEKTEIKSTTPTTEQSAKQTPQPTKKGWSLWGSSKTDEEEAETPTSAAEESASSKPEQKTRRSLWGHLKKALW